MKISKIVEEILGNEGRAVTFLLQNITENYICLECGTQQDEEGECSWCGCDVVEVEQGK